MQGLGKTQLPIPPKPSTGWQDVYGSQGNPCDPFLYSRNHIE